MTPEGLLFNFPGFRLFRSQTFSGWETHAKAWHNRFMLRGQISHQPYEPVYKPKSHLARLLSICNA